MKKIIAIMFFITALICISENKGYAQELQDNSTQNINSMDNATSAESNVNIENHKSDVVVKKKPDFNKKKISLDRIEDKKWSLRLGYAFFFPESEYTSILNHKLKIGGAYDVNKYFQVQGFLQYADGSKSYNISGIDTTFTGTVYNLGLLAIGLYPFELSAGEIAPFGSLGGVYTFGNIRAKSSIIEQKQNISGGGILAQAGLQYNINVFSIRVYGEYLYDLTPIKVDYIKSFSGFSVGAEFGVKF